LKNVSKTFGRGATIGVGVDMVFNTYRYREGDISKDSYLGKTIMDGAGLVVVLGGKVLKYWDDQAKMDT